MQWIARQICDLKSQVQILLLDPRCGDKGQAAPDVGLKSVNRFVFSITVE